MRVEDLTAIYLWLNEKRTKPKFQLGRFLWKAQVIISRQLEAIVFIILQILLLHAQSLRLGYSTALDGAYSVT